jgi:hypothetical protein
MINSNTAFQVAEDLVAAFTNWRGAATSTDSQDNSKKTPLY